jgi:hypothetical protein
MDWYIFLAPLLLLPIIFLFRLVGCTLDTRGAGGGRGDGAPDGTPLANVKFVLNIVGPIPFIPPNPIYYIWPKFKIDPGPGAIDLPYSQTIPPATETNGYPQFTTSDPVAASPGTHICSCDVSITRLNDPNPDQPDSQLIGSETVEKVFVEGENVITFNLIYTPMDPPSDYLTSDFNLSAA